MDPINPVAGNPEALNQNPQTPKDNHGITIAAMAIFVLMALGAVAFLYYQNQQLKNMLATYQIPAASPTPIATIDPTANWKVYVSPDKTFSFKYPPNFSPGSGGMVMAPMTGTNKLVYAFADNSTLAQNTDQAFDGFTVYEVTAFKTSSYNTYLAAELNAIQNSPMGNGKSNTLSQITIPGINVSKITFSDAIQLFFIETPDGKGAVVFSQSILNKNSETEIMQVLSTFKFSSSAPATKTIPTGSPSAVPNMGY